MAAGRCHSGMMVSTTLTSADLWRNSTLIRGNVPEEVSKIKALPGQNIYVDGSSMLVHTLAQHGLIDEYNLLVYPLVLGQGKKLFPEGLRQNLKRIDSRSFPTGVTQIRYQVERA